MCVDVSSTARRIAAYWAASAFFGSLTSAAPLFADNAVVYRCLIGWPRVCLGQPAQRELQVAAICGDLLSRWRWRRRYRFAKLWCGHDLSD